MRGIEIFQKSSYREISPMRDRPMRGPKSIFLLKKNARLDAIPVARAIFGFLKPSFLSHKKMQFCLRIKLTKKKNRRPIFANEIFFSLSLNKFCILYHLGQNHF